jgi:hypothetical protein
MSRSAHLPTDTEPEPPIDPLSERPAPHNLIATFRSLEELFDALHRRAVPQLPLGGFVRLHPSVVTSANFTLVELQQRLDGYGLVLFATTLVDASEIELRGYQGAGSR